MQLPAIPTDTLYNIGEAADILGVSIQTLRLYERMGLVLPYRRNSKHRRFSSRDIERIKCIRSMITENKVSIAGIGRLLSLIPCWSIKNCPADARINCEAFKQHEKPCWIVAGRSWECRNAECRECPVYTDVADCQKLKQTIASCTVQVYVEGVLSNMKVSATNDPVESYTSVIKISRER